MSWFSIPISYINIVRSNYGFSLPLEPPKHEPAARTFIYYTLYSVLGSTVRT